MKGNKVQLVPDGVKRVFGLERARYYVWLIGGPPPVKCYHVRWRAEASAARLAKLQPSDQFAVLKVKAIFQAQPDEANVATE